MMIPKDDGTYITGPFDVIGILHDTAKERFHACLWVDHPLPGGSPPGVVRLKSKLHHTEGSESFEGAVQHAHEMREKIEVADRNVWLERERVVARNFDKDGFADVMVVPDWRGC